MTADYLGIRFDTLSLPGLLAALAERAADAPFGYVVTPNVQQVVMLETADADVQAAFDAARWRVCDSRILAALARLGGARLPVVPGSDLVAAVLAGVVRPGDRLAVVGSDAAGIAALRAIYPDCDWHQHEPPPGLRHDPAARDAAAAFVAATRARFTVLAVGSPQQELIAHAAQTAGATGAGLCIGAGLDFLTGAQRRAPRLVQRLHLEWAHRLADDPRRLWRRYLVEGPRIFRIAWQRRRG